MGAEMAQPCCGSRARVRRISRSRVPCGRSIRGSGIVLPYGFYREHTPPLVEVQGEDSEPHAVLGSRGRTWLTMVFGLPMDRSLVRWRNWCPREDSNLHDLAITAT